MTEASAQGRFAGVVKIVRFNIRFYVLSAAALAGVGLLIPFKTLPPWLEVGVLCGAAVVGFWTLSSVLVSWYVYDHAGVTRWQWLPGRIAGSPHCWANIHAGLDESTPALRQLFPGTEGSAVDIYDPGEMTEPSIARARRIQPSAEPFRRGRYDALPLPESGCDVVFLLFAAHEVRAAEHRTELFREAARRLREDGRVVLVEHLRDWKNFVAFGPGFLHFHSRRSWLRSIRGAGLVVEHESPVTQFVECFVLRRAGR
ncbi:MAG TPA: class I SAM-dependent methyltransferase [Acidobacteriaceae bacterium]|jgi:SAM-dependent methyltransferase|nr:class I SAM-dependent methyltransferase [Acidobacteriaceae bacterium]